MDTRKFWSIVQDCRDASDDDMDRKDQLIKATIGRLSAEDAEGFYIIFNRMMDAAYAWDLWGAAYLINGGCGDDAFADFRASLISRGRDAYERAIANPDLLADEDISPGAWFHEGFEYAVTEGVKAALGARPKRATPPPASPAGNPWTEATVRNDFPNLARRWA